MQYRGIELVDIPSGMGGVLPAAVANHGDNGKSQVICLDDEFFTDWVLTVDTNKLKPMSYKMRDSYRRRIDKRCRP